MKKTINLIVLIFASATVNASNDGNLGYIMIDLRQQAEMTKTVCLVRDVENAAEMAGRYKRWLETNGPEITEIEKIKEDVLASSIENKSPEERVMMLAAMSVMPMVGNATMLKRWATMKDSEIKVFCHEAFLDTDKKDPGVQGVHYFFIRQAEAATQTKAACSKAIEERKNGGLDDCPRGCGCTLLTPNQLEKKKAADQDKRRIVAEQNFAELKSRDLQLWAVNRIKANCEDGVDEVLLHKEWMNAQAKDEYGTTPLLAAVAANRFSLVKRLLEAGANPNSANGLDTTPLIVAVRAEQYYNFAVDTQCGKEGSPGYSLDDRKALAELLLQYGADPFQVGKDKLNAIDESGFSDKTNTLKRLLQESATAKANRSRAE